MKNICLLCLICTQIIVGQNCNCDKVLVQDMLYYDYDENIALHYLNTVQGNISKSNGSSHVLSGNFPYEGIPIGVEVSQSDSRDYTTRLLKSVDFIYSKESSLRILKKHFSDKVLSTFSECINACNNSNKTGVFAYIEDVTADILTLKLIHKPLHGSTDRVKVLGLELEGDFEIIRENDRKFLSNQGFLVPNDAKNIRLKRKDRTKDSFIEIKLLMNDSKTTKDINLKGIPVAKEYTKMEFRSGENRPWHRFEDIIIDTRQIIEVYLSGDRDYPTGKRLVPNHKNTKVKFGHWTNRDCNQSGNEWYITGIGSCEHYYENFGDLAKGIQWFTAWVEKK